MAALVTMNPGLGNFFMSWTNMLLLAFVAVSSFSFSTKRFTHHHEKLIVPSSSLSTILPACSTTSTSTLSVPFQDHGSRGAVAYRTVSLSCLVDSPLMSWNCTNATALSFVSRPMSWPFQIRAHGRTLWAIEAPGNPNLVNRIACTAF